MKIAIYAFDGISLFHLANSLAVFKALTNAGIATWETTVCSEFGQPITTAEGLQIDQLSNQEKLLDCDLIIFPSWPNDLPIAKENLLNLIRTAHLHNTKIVGLCLGAFPVAQSGLLDKRTAVTHWAYTAQLSAQNPQVIVDDNALYVDHGDVMTSAGTASALDACLHIVRTHLGSAAAMTIARQLVIAPHREGDQAQYIERPVPQHADDPLGQVMSWALENLHQPISVEKMAEQGQMSTRNFTRQFRAATGTTPAKWLLQRRLDEARGRLETTKSSISEVAQQCGFASPITFRQNFISAYSTTPTAYRRQFGEESN